MNSKHIFLSTLVGPLVIPTLNAAETNRPNILFVISDDQSYPHASAYGSPIAKTPAFIFGREGGSMSACFCYLPGKGWGPGDWKISGRKHNPAGQEYKKRHIQPPLKGVSNTDYYQNFKEFLHARKEKQPFPVQPT